MVTAMHDDHMAKATATVRTTFAWFEREFDGARAAEEHQGRWLQVWFEQAELDAIMRRFQCASDGLVLMRGPLPGVTRPTLRVVE
jgi:hypothetical protein